MQTLPIILSIVFATTAIIVVLFWRIKPQTAVDVEPLNKRIAEEAQKVQALQAKLDTNQAALRTAEVNAAAAKATMEAANLKASDAEKRLEFARSEYNSLQIKLNQVQPAVAKAIAEKDAAETAKAEVSRQEDVLFARNNVLQAKLNETEPAVAKANAEKDAVETARKSLEQRLQTVTQKYDTLFNDYKLAVEQASSSKTDADNMRMRMGEMGYSIEALTLELNKVRQELIEAVAKQQSNDDAAHQFKNISQAILEETMEKAKREVGQLAASLQKFSGDELEKHAGKVALTLEPLQAKLQAYDEAIKSMAKDASQSYGSLTRQISDLQQAERSLHEQAKALTTALSSSPKIKGMYGELLLKQLVEFVGMQEQCHFEEQASRHTEEGRKIPDLVIFLPGGQKVIVDAKAVMNACVEAYQAQEEVQRGILLKRHCENVKARVIELSAKNYFADHSDAVESVVLFLPAENLYATAVENDPELTEFAMRRNIIICGPNSLMMLLKVANQLWRRAAIEEEAQKIKECGDGIYKSACDFIEKFAKLGARISQLEDQYNDAAGTLDARLIPKGREMSRLTALANGREMEEIPKLKDGIRDFRSIEAKRLLASTSKLPGLIVGDETQELTFSAGEES